METARIFQTGRSQAVRLPLDNPWAIMQEALTEFEEGFVLERGEQGEQGEQVEQERWDDFMHERLQPEQQVREVGLRLEDWTG